MPNKLVEVTLARFQSFDEVGATIEGLRRLNVFFGANNSGKSKLLASVQRLTPSVEARPYLLNDSAEHYSVAYKFKLGNEVIKQIFAGGQSGGVLGSDWWQSGGRNIDTIECDVRIATRNKGPELLTLSTKYKNAMTSDLTKAIDKILRSRPEILAPPVQSELGFVIAAERDIRPEGGGGALRIQSNGQGITTAIRRNLLVSSEDSSLVREHMLHDLNVLMHPQYNFREITVREHEKQSAWEVHLITGNGDVVRLSQCGSGLKTILCLLANIHLGVEARDEPIESGLFLFEELENSLHPRLQRNVYSYINERFVENAICLISTHSSIALDYYQSNNDAAFFHVSQDEGQQTRCRRVEALDDKLGVLDALGVRASDALLSNFVIWVEGPTDRIYINHWLRLAFGEKVREGRDYAVMFYGGRLLAHLTADPRTAASELIKLLNINPRCAIVIDSDKAELEAKLNFTKERIKAEFEQDGRLCWITEGREIENYISSEFLEKTFELPKDETHQYAKIFDAVKGRKGPGSATISAKIELAAVIESTATADDFQLDWRGRITDLYNAITKAND